jgi:DNA-binding transcriptional ArsR family regulator
MKNQVYRALADPTRRRILQMLRRRDMSAGEIAGHFDVTKPTMSKHFTVLKEADLIQGTREGTTIMYTLNMSVLEEALMGFMGSFKVRGGK